MSNRIVNDHHGHAYLIHLPGDRAIDLAIKPKEFHDPLSTGTFVRGLQYSDNQWCHLLHSIDKSPQQIYRETVDGVVIRLFVQGYMKLYPIAHLSPRGHATSYLTIPADNGMQYRFIPASLLLVENLRNVRIFRDKDTAEKFIQSLNLTDAQIETIITAHLLPTQIGPAPSRARLAGLLLTCLAKTEIALHKAPIPASPPKPIEGEDIAVNGPGNRPATLGPHVGSGSPTTAATTTPTSKSINDQFNDLKTQGHGPQRHEGDVTPQQLEARCTKGIDPMSGTTTDAVTGKEHKYSKHATKVNTPEDYVKGENYLRNSKEFSDEMDKANNLGKPIFSVEGTKLEDIYGSGYASKVSGRTRVGPKTNPTSAEVTDFTNGTMTGVYTKSSNGTWELLTMYPNP